MGSAVSKKYHRDFIIFSNEDSGYEDGKKPSGHIVIEVRDKKAKLSAVIQNLRNGSGKFGYGLYMIRTGKGTAEYARAGEIRHIGSRAELDLVLDQWFIEGTIYSVNDYDTFAVIVEYGNKPGPGIVCPLAAYRNGRTDWRNGLRKVMQDRSIAESVQKSEPQPEKDEGGNERQPGPGIIPTQEYEDQTQIQEPGAKEATSGAAEDGTQYADVVETEDKAERDVLPVEADETGTEKEDGTFRPEDRKIYDHIDEARYEEILEAGGSEAGGTPKEYAQYPEYTKMDNEEEMLGQHEGSADGRNGSEVPVQSSGDADDSDKAQEAGESSESDEVSDALYMKAAETADTAETSEQAANNEDAAKNVEDPKRNQRVQKPPGIEYRYPGNAGNLDTECVYLNGNICGAVLDAWNAASPCASCRVGRHAASGIQETRGEGDLDGLEEELGRSFDVCDPFHSRRSDYIWWRVTNPVNLNNMFYQSNIRSPLMFNPAVMMSHYKYKHLIVGIFTHKSGQRYIICGVPGMYMVDPNPFGETGKWVQAEGNRQRYGAFGYWLLYIDPRDGKVISF
jgi:hypothetical protein